MRRPLLRYLWASPATLVGLILASIAGVLGAKAAMSDGIIEVAGGRLGRCLSRLPGALRFHAITFGHVIIGIDHVAITGCRAHEQVHVRQYERWGLLFFPLYLGSSLWQFLRGRSPYWDNHFEQQAYRECATGIARSPEPRAPKDSSHDTD
ncbi:MAG: hypothetical protein ACRESW_09305 [Nevskiales bacterium]